MKRTLILLLVSVMVFGVFAGCGKTQTPETEPTTQATTSPTEMTTEPVTEPTTAPTEPTMSDEDYAALMQEAMNSGVSQGGDYNDTEDVTPQQTTLADPKDSKFLVGYAKVDITPNTSYKLPLVGNNDEKTRYATGILTRLYATCTAMTDEKGTTVIVFALDTHGISKKLLESVREGVTKATGVKAKYIQMTASHTHQGPPLTPNSYGAADSTKHFNDVVKKLVKVAQDAMADRKKAQMYTGYTRVDGVNFTRYTYLQDGTFLGAYRTSGDAKSYSPAEKSDNLLQVVRFDRESGKDVAIVNWQAHYRGNPDGYYTLYSADYIGVLRDELGKKAGCETMVILGAGGNLASRTEVAGLNSEANKDYIAVGQSLASGVADIWNYLRLSKTGKIAVEEKIFNITTNSNDYRLATFGIGDVGFCMMPYEPFQSLGMAVRKESPYYMTFVGSCANGNDSNFYLPDAKAYEAKNGYGVSKKYVAGDEQKFHKQYISMLKKCFSAGGTSTLVKGEDYVITATTFKDTATYTNPKNLTAVKNGLYRIDVKKNGKDAVLLVKSESLAKQLLKKSSFKVITDTRSVVTAIQ